MKVLVILLFLTILGSHAQDVEIDNKCSYTLGTKILACISLDNANTTTIANFLTTDTHFLIIRNTTNPIEISSKSFENSNFKSIDILHLINNAELTIQSGGFNGLNSLRNMKIRENSWNVLKSRTFETLDLEILDLSRNNLAILEGDCFKGLKNLNTLDMNSNQLSKVPTGVFEDLINLKQLFLDQNQIEIIMDDTFKGLSNLELLDLSRNSIKSIEAHIFSGLTNLRALLLGFNKIERIQGSFAMMNLFILEIKHNNLKEVSDETFVGLVKVTDIDLSDNSLKSITETPFVKLPMLKNLNLSSNGADDTKFSNVGKKAIVIV